MTEPTWEVVFDNRKHYCTRPNLKSDHPDIVSGTIIKCKVCHQHWECTGWDSGMQWDPYPAVLTWKERDKPMIISAW
ncbi:hypothetical protein SEA_ATUIN_259 [Arthrobacter phage Atuin]|nr:hypothetical protein SEA_ATUIN_58 [Arthrobacter phage Atuin]